jgi:hypothetical protein
MYTIILDTLGEATQMGSNGSFPLLGLNKGKGAEIDEELDCANDWPDFGVVLV